MKKLTIVLAIILVIIMLAACGEATLPQTTTTSTSGEGQSGASTTATTGHSSHDSITGTTGNQGEGEIIAPTDDDDFRNDDLTSDDTTTTIPDDSSSTTATTTRPQGSTTITTTVKGTTATTKATTTTTNKSTTTTTTKKTTTTTTKKTTTTTTKTTTHTHTFSGGTYAKNNADTHKVTGKCTSCGVSTTATEYHTWGTWKYDTQPTSTEPGIKYRVCTGCGYEQVTYVPPTSQNVASFNDQMLELINAERAKKGLPAYSYYTAGQVGADTRAKEIMTSFSHNRPDGTKWWTAPGFEKAVCQSGAENIARGYATPKDLMAALMASSDNSKNILSTKYTHVVVAYYEGAWVQIFVSLW